MTKPSSLLPESTVHHKNDSHENYRDFQWKFVKRTGNCESVVILIVTPDNQFYFPNFFHEIFSVWPVWKENKLFIGPKLRKKPVLEQKKFTFFSTDKTEKNLRKKLGKIRMKVWWFGVTNKILNSLSIFPVNHGNDIICIEYQFSRYFT